MIEGEEEKQLLDTVEQLKAELIELKKEKTQKPTGGYGEYISGAQFYANVPKDPYAHQYMMVHRPSKEIIHPSDLLSPDVLLSNIKDTRTMLIYQRDFYFLHRFFNLGQRSEAVMKLFNALYFPWEGQMRMTATMGGKERDLQSFLTTEEETGGFGIPFLKRKAPQKKKNITDWLTPQEERGPYE